MIINRRLAGKKTATVYGEIKFNDRGESQDLTKDQQKAIGKIRGFQYKEDKPKEEKPKSKPKEDKPKEKAPSKKSTK